MTAGADPGKSVNAEEFFQAMEDFFDAHLTDEDYDHRSVTEMHDLFCMELLEAYARASFGGHTVEECRDIALARMADVMDDAREAADDDRE